MNAANRNMMVRSASGAVYVAAIAVCVLSGRWSWLGMSLILCIGAVCELRHIDGGRNGWLTAFDALWAAATAAGLQMLVYTASGPELPLALWVLAVVWAFCLVARPAMQLWQADENALQGLGASFMGVIWVGVPLGLTAWLATGVAGRWMLLGVFILIWLNDTGAYLWGRALGRHRMWERISPKKTWEGLIGGFGTTVAGAAVMALCFPECWGAAGLGRMLAVGALVSVTATLGDLVESLLKRTAGVKDAGHIMPGHGGVLDRIDSLLMVVPAVALLLLVWQ